MSGEPFREVHQVQDRAGFGGGGCCDGEVPLPVAALSTAALGDVEDDRVGSPLGLVPQRALAAGETGGADPACYLEGESVGIESFVIEDVFHLLVSAAGVRLPHALQSADA